MSAAVPAPRADDDADAAAAEAALGPRLPPAVLEAAAALPTAPDGVTLRGRFVVLTPRTLADAADVSAAFSGAPYLGHPAYDASALVYRYMMGLSAGSLATPAAAAAYEAAAAAPNRTQFVVRLTPEGVAAFSPAAEAAAAAAAAGAPPPLLALLSLMSNRPRDLCVEIGGVMATPAAQATPVITEATVLLLRHVFGLGYRRVEWKCNNRNARSKAAAARLGFTYEGVFRDHMLVAGHSRDTAWFSLLGREWEGGVGARHDAWLASPAAPALFARRAAQLAEARGAVDGGAGA